MVRANYYGEHYDERGRIRGVDGNAPTKLLGSTVFVDLELRFDVGDHTRLALGGTNVLDEYPDVIGPPYASRLKRRPAIRAAHRGQLRGRLLVPEGVLPLVTTRRQAGSEAEGRVGIRGARRRANPWLEA